jgi:hypothetical protein
LCDRAGTVRFLDDVNATPLGTMGKNFATARADLSDGDLVVLYTDGLIERRDHLIDDGLTWLAERTRSMCNAPAADICRSLVDRSFSSSPSADDICVLVLRVRSQEADWCPSCGRRRWDEAGGRAVSKPERSSRAGRHRRWKEPMPTCCSRFAELVQSVDLDGATHVGVGARPDGRGRRTRLAAQHPAWRVPVALGCRSPAFRCSSTTTEGTGSVRAGSAARGRRDYIAMVVSTGVGGGIV